MKPIIRLAQITDVPAMHAIRLSVQENRLSRPDAIDMAAYHFYIEQSSCWIAVIEDEIVGFSALDVAKRQVWALFVAPAAEGKGIGKLLHRELINSAVHLGFGKISLTTDAKSRAARFYEAANWQFIGLCADSGEAIYEMDLETS